MLENPMYLATPDEPIPCPGESLTPMTCDAAFDLFVAGRRKPFSFMSTKFGLKTIMAIRGKVVVAPLSAGRGRLGPAPK